MATQDQDDLTGIAWVRDRLQSVDLDPFSDENDNLTASVFLLPDVVAFTAFKFVPFLFALYLSFQSWNLFMGTGEWAWTTVSVLGVSLELPIANYVDVLTPAPWTDNWGALQSPSYNLWWYAFRNTIVYMLLVVPTQIVGGFLLALALDSRIRGLRIYRAAYFVPVMLSAAASGVIWRWLMAENGVINRYLEPLGVAHPWANDPSTALVALALIGIWGGIGFNMIFYLSGLQNIPDELYEAARIDGASTLQRIRHVTWPNLRNTHFFVTVVAIIGTFQVFGIAMAFAQGGPYNATTTIVVLIYRTAFERSQFGSGAAMAFLLFVAIFAFSYYQYRYNQQQEVDY